MRFQVHLGQKRTKLYIVPGIASDTPFAPLVRKVTPLLGAQSLGRLPCPVQHDCEAPLDDLISATRFGMHSGNALADVGLAFP